MDDDIFENYESEEDNTELVSDINNDLAKNEEINLHGSKIEISEEDDNSLDFD